MASFITWWRRIFLALALICFFLAFGEPDEDYGLWANLGAMIMCSLFIGIAFLGQLFQKEDQMSRMFRRQKVKK